MSQIINQALNINVTNNIPAVPNTGGTDAGTSTIAQVADNLGAVGCSMLIVTILALVAGAMVLLIRYKRSRKQTSLLLGVGLLAIGFGLFVPSLAATSEAISKATATPDQTTTIDITATPEGNIATADTTITLTDTAYHGYTVYAYMENDNALYNQDHSAKIAATNATAANPASLTDNSYGLKSLLTDSYHPITTNAEAPLAVYTTDEMTAAGASVNLTFATKVDTNTPAGTYTGNIIFKIEPKTSEVTYLQEVTPEYCQALTIDEEIPLIDVRDGKTYNITRHKDGKCWMTQDLQLGSDTASIELTPETSDVTTNFTLPMSTDPDDWTLDQDTPHMKTDQKGESSYGYNYNWNAATAGTGNSSVTSGEAPSSICPKGWKLPQDDGSITATGNNDFYKLMNHYFDPNDWYDDHWTDYSGIATQSPLNFNTYPKYWSRTLSDANQAYSLYLEYGCNQSVGPIDHLDRSDGGRVRCIFSE